MKDLEDNNCIGDALQTHPIQPLRFLSILDKHRVAWLLTCLLLGSATGFLSAISLSRNLKASSIAVPGLGQIHRIALPRGVHRRSDIWKFEIRNEAADDFSRVYVNNYIVLSSEQPELFVGINAKEQIDVNESKTLLQSVLVPRAQPFGKTLVDFHLKTGWNVIVLELDNRIGPCQTRLEMLVNDELIRGIPSEFPTSFSEIQNLAAGESTIDVVQWRDGTEYPVKEPVIEDGLCARRIFQFWLDE